MARVYSSLLRPFKRFVYTHIINEPVTLLVPAYNEGPRIGKVLEAAKKSKLVTEIIVIDDGSRDNTAEIADRLGVKVIKHKKNMGKGAAMRTGIRNASSEIILFLDADIGNLSPKTIDELVLPAVCGDADFVKGGFNLERGRVTELTVKPILKSLYPEIKLSQPISGQFCAKKGFLDKIEIQDDWGIDIAILIEAVNNGLRIEEVEMGKLKHKARPMHEKVKMAEEVTKTIFEKAGLIKKYELIAFDLDGTLTKERTIDPIAKKFGFYPELARLRKKLKNGKIKDVEITKFAARRLAGKTVLEIDEICEKMELNKNAAEVVKKFREKRYKIYILSQALSPITEYFAKKLGIDNYVCPVLVERKGVFTGKVKIPVFNKSQCGYHYRYGCKAEELAQIARRNRVDMKHVIAVGNGAGDACMVAAAGLGVLIGTSNNARKIAGIKLENLAELLLYA